MAKYKLIVIFGTAPCNYAEEHGVKEAVEAFKNGKFDSLEGMWRTYELDTKEDAEQLIQALDDAWGWDESTATYIDE